MALHTITLAAESRRDTVRNAIARTVAHELALVFPLGVHCALADADELAALYTLCEAAGKAVVVIGGDARLRASAVAAGFAAATSLEEWETTTHRALTRAGAKRCAGKDAGPTPQAGYLSVLSPEEDETEPGLYELAGEDPPAFIADLMPHDDVPVAERLAAIPTLPRVPTVGQQRRDEARREAAQAAAQERAQQAYEERMTETIRASGLEEPPAQSTTPATEPDDLAASSSAAEADNG